MSSLDPKKFVPTVKRRSKASSKTVGDGWDVTPADPTAALLEPCSACSRPIGFDDLDQDAKDWLLAEVRKGVASQTNASPDASPIQHGYDEAAAAAKKDLAKATGGRDYENDFRLRLRLEEVPRLLPGNPQLLCYPPFANLFISYLSFGNPKTVRKTLLALHRQALQRKAAAARAMRIWEKCRKIAGQVMPIAEVARAEKLSVSMVKKRLSEARHLLGRPKRRRDEGKKKRRPAIP